MHLIFNKKKKKPTANEVIIKVKFNEDFVVVAKKTGYVPMFLLFYWAIFFFNAILSVFAFQRIW